MLKVKTDKLLADYNALVEKQEKKLAAIEAQVRPFAATLGYDEEKTQSLIDYVQEQQGNGLSEEDGALLNFLDEYIEEVEDTPIEQATETKPTDPNASNLRVNVV